MKNCVVHKIHGNVKKLKGHRKSPHAIAALAHVVKQNAMPHPHVQQKLIDGSQECEIHLPLGLTKNVLMETLNKTLEDEKCLSIGKSTFYKI